MNNVIIPFYDSVISLLLSHRDSSLFNLNVFFLIRNHIIGTAASKVIGTKAIAVGINAINGAAALNHANHADIPTPIPPAVTKSLLTISTTPSF